MDKYNFALFSERYNIKALKFSRAEAVFESMCDYSKSGITNITEDDILSLAKDNVAAVASYMYTSHLCTVINHFYEWISEYDGKTYEVPLFVNPNNILLKIVDFKTIHYKDIEDVIESIMKEKHNAKRMKPSAIFDDNEITTIFDMLSCIVILYWYGFSFDQIYEIKRSDVKGDGVELNGSLVNIPEHFMRIINQVLNAKCYTPYTRTRYAVFVESEYLLRNHKTDKFAKTLISWMILRYNQYVSTHQGRVINLISLKSDRTFCEIKKYEDCGLTIKQASRKVYRDYFSQNSITYFEDYVMPMYKIWRDVFYEE